MLTDAAHEQAEAFFAAAQLFFGSLVLGDVDPRSQQKLDLTVRGHGCSGPGEPPTLPAASDPAVFELPGQLAGAQFGRRQGLLRNVTWAAEKIPQAPSPDLVDGKAGQLTTCCVPTCDPPLGIEHDDQGADYV